MSINRSNHDWRSVSLGQKASLERLIWRPSPFSQILLLGVFSKAIRAELTVLITSSNRKRCSVGDRMQVPGCMHAQGFIKNAGLLLSVKQEFCMFYGSVMKS